MDIPWLWRWLAVNLLIVPWRAPRSAGAYQKIWSPEGSPLLRHHLHLTEMVAQQMPEIEVLAAMRYNEPPILQALKRVVHSDEILVFPLYPQYSLSASQSSRQKVMDLAARLGITKKIKFVGDFYSQSGFIESFKRVFDETASGRPFDHYLMSFHGLPQRQITCLDHTGAHCLRRSDCCDQLVQVNRQCYRAQCFATASALARRLNLSPRQWSVAFQSRLGRTPWIEPFTDVVIPKLASRGVRRLAVFCPSFVADCLETLEEIAIRAREQFIHAGGEELQLIPSLNSHPYWVQTVVEMIRCEL